MYDKLEPEEGGALHPTVSCIFSKLQASLELTA